MLHPLSALILALQVSSAPSAPPADAVGVYTLGIAAVKASEWESAITFMNAAMSIDPTPRSYQDSGAEHDYYPQYYLFVAHLKTGDLAAARRFDESRGNLPVKLTTDAR